MKDLTVELIKDLYTFHEYEISKEKAYEIADIILEMRTPPENRLRQFFKSVKMGVYGTFYKNPTCLTSMYNKWKISNFPLV